MEVGAGEPEGRDPLMRRSNSGGSTLLELDIAKADLDHAVRSGVRQAFICGRTGEYRQPLRSHHTHGGSSLQIWGIMLADDDREHESSVSSGRDTLGLL
jgi:hypothetical protein